MNAPTGFRLPQSVTPVKSRNRNEINGLPPLYRGVNVARVFTLWHYLAGSAAWLGEKQGVPTLAARARAHFAQARDASVGIRWLAGLARYHPGAGAPAVAMEKQALEAQIERLEALLLKLGTLHDGRYSQHERTILDGLAAGDAKTFEMAQRDLGEMLGFQAGKHESDASPDPWWIAGNYCLVFEDHSDALPTSTLGAAKARQVAGHPNWVRNNKDKVELPKDAHILPILVTPVTKAEDGAFPHLNDVALWRLNEFRDWARNALTIVRDLRRNLGDECDLAWRAQAQEVLEANGLDAPTLINRLSGLKAAQGLKR
jgi:hypothetical protein